MTLLHQFGGGGGFRSGGICSSLASSHSHPSLLRLSWSPDDFADKHQQQHQQLHQQQQPSGLTDVSPLSTEQRQHSPSSVIVRAWHQHQHQQQHQHQRHHSGSGRRSSATKVLPKQLLDGQEVFLCPVCDLHGRQVLVRTKFELTTHLRTHNRTSEMAGLHRCAICSKELSSQSSLDRHMLTHSDERPFACPLCPTAFTTNGNMRRHMQTHRSDPALASEVDRHLRGEARRRARRPDAGDDLAAAEPSPKKPTALPSEPPPPPPAVVAAASGRPPAAWLARALKRRSVRMLRRQLMPAAGGCGGKKQQRPVLSPPPRRDTPLELPMPTAAAAEAEEQPLDLSLGKALLPTPVQPLCSVAPLPSFPIAATAAAAPVHPAGPQWASAAAVAAAAAAAAYLPWQWSLRLAALAGGRPHPHPVAPTPQTPPGLWLPTAAAALRPTPPPPPASPAKSLPPAPSEPLLSMAETTASAASASDDDDDTLDDLSGGDDDGPAGRLARRKSRKNSYKEAPNLIYCPFDACRQAFPWMSSLKRHIITHTSHKPYACTRCEHAFSTKSNRERHMERIHGVRVKGRHCLARLAQDELAAFREHDRIAESIGEGLLNEMGSAVVMSANPHRGGGFGGGPRSELELVSAALSDSSSSR